VRGGDELGGFFGGKGRGSEEEEEEEEIRWLFFIIPLPRAG